MGYLLGIDVGTTLTTTLLLDGDLRPVAHISLPTGYIYPRPGQAELSPEGILASSIAAADGVISKAGINYNQIDAIGIDHQGETCCVWERETAETIYPAIGWQDRRTNERINALSPDEKRLILNSTGLVPDAYYSATKLEWILKNAAAGRDISRLEAGTLNTYLIKKLCGTYTSDACTGGRYMLMDLRRTEWDERLLSMFGIPRGILPPLGDCAGNFGITRGQYFGGAGIPVTGTITDSNAALLGSGIRRPGVLKASYGTGCFMSLYTGFEPYISPDGKLSSTCTRRLDGRAEYTVCGAVYSAGYAVEQLRKAGIITDISETSALASEAKHRGAYFIPAHNGMGTPYWNQDARATFTGIGALCGRAELVRAVLEGVALRVNDCVEAMREAGCAVREIVAGGGMCRNEYLMQFQADITGLPVKVLKEKEMSAYGAACLAGIGLGRLKIEDIPEISDFETVYYPSMHDDEREELLDGWREAINSIMYKKERFFH